MRRYKPSGPSAAGLRGDGRDYPGGRRDARDAVNDERLERVAYGIDHAGSILGVFAEEPAERSDLERELERGRAIVAANRLVVRSHADGAESGGPEDPGEARAIREREGAGCVRIRRWRQRREVPRGGHHRDGHDRVLRLHAPAHERDAAAGLQGAAQVREGGHRIVEEHDAEARVDGVERLLEGVLLSVGVYERDVRIPAAPARCGEQRQRHVDTYDAAGRSDSIGELQARLPAAAADVEDVLTPARGERAKGGAAERIELTIESLLLGDLEPVRVMDGLRGFLDSDLRRRREALLGGADHVDLLVDAGHALLPGVWSRLCYLNARQSRKAAPVNAVRPAPAASAAEKSGRAQRSPPA